MIFDSFRTILHEGSIDLRVQYMIEELFAVRKSGFQGHAGIPEGLDLVEAEDQITHDISLDMPGLDVHEELSSIPEIVIFYILRLFPT